MNMIRWEPFQEMEDMMRRMMPNVALRTRLLNDGEVDWAPTADISETDKEYLIRAELPAVKREDVHITIDQGMITISGERKQEKEEKNEKRHRVESFYGSFCRSFSIPDNVDEKSVRAESKDGILTVHLPKTKVEAPKAIEVKIQ